MRPRFVATRPVLRAAVLASLLLASACGGPAGPDGEEDPPPGGQGVSAVAAGSSFSVALMDDGTVYAWGLNSSGQLGNGGLGDASRPVRVVGLEGVSQIAAGLRHVLALDTSGQVWAWGHNNRGQIGLGWPGPTLETQEYRQPVDVGLSSIVAVVARGDSSYALDASGTVWAWGNNSYYELGDGTNQSRGEPAAIAFPEGVVIEALFAGVRHARAIDSDGGVWIWGDDAFNLGNGSAAHIGLPTKADPASALGLLGSAEFSASGGHVLAIGPGGELHGWGSNSAGELAMPGTTSSVGVPTPVPDAPTPVSSVAAGGSFSVAVSEGAVYTWGTSYFGELGDGTSDGATRRQPASLEGLTNVTAVAAAPLRNPSFGRHVLALTADGDIYAWGFNRSGELGKGDEVDALEPVLVRFE